MKWLQWFQKKYQLEELIPSVSEFVSHLKEVGIDGEIPKTFKRKYPWVKKYLKNKKRVKNLYNLIQHEGTRVEYVNPSLFQLSANNLRCVRIRVSFTEVRNQNAVYSEVLTFQEVEPNAFIYRAK